MSRKVWSSFAVVLVATAIAIAAAYQVRRSDPVSQKKPAAPVKLVLGMAWVPSNANVVLATQSGFFRDERLDVSLQPYPSGQLAFADLLNGKSDLAMVGATPLAFESLRGARFHVLATTYESDESTKLVGRRDRGIEKPSDLAGKKLGTVFATTSEFVQDSILVLNNGDPRTNVRVNLAPAKTVDALLAGEMIP